MCLLTPRWQAAVLLTTAITLECRSRRQNYTSACGFTKHIPILCCSCRPFLAPSCSAPSSPQHSWRIYAFPSNVLNDCRHRCLWRSSTGSPPTCLWSYWRCASFYLDHPQHSFPLLLASRRMAALVGCCQVCCSCLCTHDVGYFLPTYTVSCNVALSNWHHAEWQHIDI